MFSERRKLRGAIDKQEEDDNNARSCSAHCYPRVPARVPAHVPAHDSWRDNWSWRLMSRFVRSNEGITSE
jgi:hypothetical protein